MSDFPTRISHAEALVIVRTVAAEARLASERVAIGRADGRILAQDLVAPIDLPPFDNSRMDGFALRHADLSQNGETRSAHHRRPVRRRDARARPAAWRMRAHHHRRADAAGADTVVIKENAFVQGSTLSVPQGVSKGAHVGRAGEDVRKGEVVLHAGSPLTPARISLVAALGLPELEVSQRPTVAVFTTGDELVEPGLPLLAGQIYNSNRELLMGLLRGEGLEPVAWPTLPDDPRAHGDPVARCGLGVRLGVDLWRSIRRRKGSGAGTAASARSPAFLEGADETRHAGVYWVAWTRRCSWACPGIRSRVLATFLALGRPLLDELQGRTEARARCFARLTTPWIKTHERLEFLRGRLQHWADGVLGVAPNPADASHRLRAATESDALIVLEEGPRDYAAGTVVEVIEY